uniref:Nuclear receptor domain-containing protein n=1 Tax=Panagrolaimus davidi TaxID=227884 RepID=A0A914R000_9BILA
MPGNTPLNCLICGGISYGYHFGILACRACAAFFRRTDYNNMEIFFTDMATRNQDATDIIHKNVKRTRKTFSTLKIDECEIAALAGIMLWNEAAQILPNWLPGEKAKEQIFQELHGYLINKYGNVNIGIRIGSLITTLHELSNAARAISEHRTMEKLFNPGVIDLLMDELPNG